MDQAPQAPAARAAYLPVVAAIALFVVIVLRTAWISDDAYITFRTIENFLAGDGLRWNIAERVQVYTHPLWLFLLSGLCAVTREPYLTTIAVSVVLSVAGVLIIAGRVAIAALPALIGVVALGLSKAYTDYSTSGLENPLTHLLLAAFALVFLTGAPGRRTILWMSLLAALLALTRLDALLLVLPALVMKMWRVRAFRELTLGFVPLIAWEAFALIYYGFLLPNTAYAKLVTGLPHQTLAARGLFYIAQTLQDDPLTLVMLVVGLLAPLLMRTWHELPLVIGALLYIAYIICVGGDFMLGRFLTAPLLVAVVLLARQRLTTLTSVILLVLVLITGLIATRSPLRSDEKYGSDFNATGPHGLQDERAFYYPWTGLLPNANALHISEHKFAVSGLSARGSRQPVVRDDSIGLFAVYAGRDVFVVDQLGLGDAFLARLTPTPDKDWSIGHLRREIPAGYLQTLADGCNQIADPALAAYYDRIALATRGPLFAPRRWAAIVELNLGLVQPPQP
jgi:arabinofuranosyltransferase